MRLQYLLDFTCVHLYLTFLASWEECTVFSSDFMLILYGDTH